MRERRRRTDNSTTSTTSSSSNNGIVDGHAPRPLTRVYYTVLTTTTPPPPSNDTAILENLTYRSRIDANAYAREAAERKFDIEPDGFLTNRLQRGQQADGEQEPPYLEKVAGCVSVLGRDRDGNTWQISVAKKTAAIDPTMPAPSKMDTAAPAPDPYVFCVLLTERTPPNPKSAHQDDSNDAPTTHCSILRTFASLELANTYAEDYVAEHGEDGDGGGEDAEKEDGEGGTGGAGGAGGGNRPHYEDDCYSIAGTDLEGQSFDIQVVKQKVYQS